MAVRMATPVVPMVPMVPIEDANNRAPVSKPQVERTQVAERPALASPLRPK